MESVLCVVSLLLSLAALLAAGATWATLSMRVRELELRGGTLSNSLPPGKPHAPAPQDEAVPTGEFPPCSPRVRLLARTLARKDEAIQIYRNENNVSEAVATAAIEKLLAE